MIEGAGKVFAVLFVIAAGIYIIGKIISDVGTVLGPLLSVIIVVSLAIGGIYYLAFHRPMKQAAAHQATLSPGPMKVDITEDHTPGKRGARCSFLIEAKLSQEDQDVIDRAGFREYALFTWKNPNSPWPEQPDTFFVKNLPGNYRAYFFDVIDMQNAKKELIEAIHALKSRIEALKIAEVEPQKTSIEL